MLVRTLEGKRAPAKYITTMNAVARNRVSNQALDRPCICISSSTTSQATFPAGIVLGNLGDVAASAHAALVRVLRWKNGCIPPSALSNGGSGNFRPDAGHKGSAVLQVSRQEEVGASRIMWRARLDLHEDHWLITGVSCPALRRLGRAGLNYGLAHDGIKKFSKNNTLLAERGGFEPPIPLRVCRISSAVQSTTLPPLPALVRAAIEPPGPPAAAGTGGSGGRRVWT